MEIKLSKMFDMSATIMARLMANPGNGLLINDQYGQQAAFATVFCALEQVRVQRGTVIIEDADK